MLDLRDGEPAGRESLGHLKADVAGADDHGSLDVRLLEGVHQREGVAHRVQQVHALFWAEVIETANRRLDGKRAGADDQRVVGE